MRVIVIALSLLLALAAAPQAWAELIVKDTGDNVRYHDITEDSSDITFSIQDASGMPAEGATITLRNEVTGAKVEAVSAGGQVVFPDIAPGTYVVESATPDITFTQVLVTAASGAAVGAGITPALAAFGLVAGGTTAIAVTHSGDSGDNDVPLSPFQ